MEATRVRAVEAHSIFVFQHKGNLNDSGKTRSHQCVAKNGVNHGADHQRLGMSRHRIAGQQNDDCGDEIPLGAAISLPAHPNTQKTCTPPDDAHSGMLQIIVYPWSSPTMLRKGVDASPGRDDQGVEELLTAAGAAQPVLTNEQQDSKHDTIGNERTAHDEMRQTLSEMITLAEAIRRDTPEEHLRPANNRHRLAENAVKHYEEPTDPTVESFGEM